MPALKVAMGWALLAAVGVGGLAGCKTKASPPECDQMVERYARLVVVEKYPDAGADLIKTEQERVKAEAQSDDSFKNCSSEVSRAELDCAMRAATADAIEKCLE